MHTKDKKEKQRSIQSLAIDFVESHSESTFKPLIERLKPGLMMFVYKYLGNDRDMCQEIVAQTFVNVWEKINQYDKEFNFSTWVYAIARNEALGQLRQNRKIHQEQSNVKFLKLYSTPFYMDLECMGPNNEELTDHLYDLTLKEIDLLDEPYKTVMYEREVNKKPLHDIADILDWNLNTVKTRLRKARQELAINLMKKYPELIEAYNEFEE